MVWEYYVYVIELDDAAGPRLNPDYPCVYVGQSVHPPEVRFQQHLDGIHASRSVRQYGRKLRPDLYERFNPVSTREKAECIERGLATILRWRGYTVRGGS